MAAAAAPEPPTTTLLELALACGFTVADQRWRARAACANADPETFLIDRGASPEPALVYCCRCEVRTECLQAALDLNQQAVGVWVERALESGAPPAGRGGTPSGCSRSSARYAEGGRRRGSVTALCDR